MHRKPSNRNEQIAGHGYAEEKPGKGGMKLGLSRQVLQQTAFQPWPEQTSPGCSSQTQPFQWHFTKSTRESARAVKVGEAAALVSLHLP